MKKQKILYTILALLLPFSMVLAQEQLSLRDQAAASFQRFEYARSAEIYSQLAERKDPRLQDLERAGDSYYNMRDFTNAENWYARVIQHEDHQAIHALRYADILKANGKYESAKAQYQRYAERSGRANAVAVQIAGCDSALLWMANPTSHALANEQAVNTTGSEFAVSMIANVVHFAGEIARENKSFDAIYAWTGRPFLKLHHASIQQDGSLGTPTLVGAELNNPNYHVGPVASPDHGQTLYVTRTHVGKEVGVEKVKGTEYRTHRLEIYIYETQNGKWTATPFEHNDPENFSVGHAAFSLDGQTIYFASDRPGGQGGTDIWYSTRKADGTWATPINAGNQINTAGEELFPVIGADGSLYYSTDGLAGMGGLDVFQSQGSKDAWETPVNLGFPLNSSADDFSFVIVKDNDQLQSGYLSSNRLGGKGEDDIYAFHFLKPQPKHIQMKPAEIHLGRLLNY